MKTLKRIGLAAGSLLPGVTLAAQTDPATLNTGIDDPNQIINNIIGWILLFAAAIAVLFLVIGGIRYIISAGNPDQAGAAKKTILYAIIGLIIILLSYAIVNLIFSGILNEVLK